MKRLTFKSLFAMSALLSVFIIIGLGITSTFFSVIIRPFLHKAPVQSLLTQPSPHVPTIQIGSVIYTVEIADTDAKRQQGLSGRDPLPENHGMLFVFPNRQIQAFWMKDMKFNLDMVWIDGDKIVDITENVPAPLQNEANLPIFKPKAPVTAVLEINAGEVKKNGFVVGQATLLLILKK